MQIPERGELEKWRIPESFLTKEVFCVSNVPAGVIRGNHAHRTCTQILIIMSGKVKITLETREGLSKILMPDDTRVVIINPLTWSTQEYLTKNSRLLVLCSEEFNDDEYIREYKQFSQILKEAKQE